MTQTEQEFKQPEQHTNPNNNLFKYCNIQRKFIPYDKETVIDKLEENLDAILKYWTGCESEKNNLFKHSNYLHTRDYIRSRIENIYNLLSSLSYNKVLPWEEFNEFIKDYDTIKKEFEKDNAPINEKDWENHLLIVSLYIDTVLSLSVFNENEDDDDDESIDIEFDDDVNENEFIVPDNVSIININNENKKRKF